MTLVSPSEAGFSFDSGTLAANALPCLGLVCRVVQFNLRLILAFLLDEYLSPSVVNHTFLYLYPRDR